MNNPLNEQLNNEMLINMTELLQLTSITGTTFLALLFLHAITHKLVDMPRFSGSLAHYRLLPAAMIHGVAYLLVTLEGISIAMLLIPALNRAGTCMAMGLLVLYTVAMAINLVRGNVLIQCGCGGPGLHLSYGLVLRNALLVLMGLPGLLVETMHIVQTTQLPLVGVAVAVVCGAIICLIYLIAEQLLANASKAARYFLHAI